MTAFRNFMTAAMMELIAEVLVFAEKTGLGVDAMESLIEQQYGPLAHAMCKRMTSGGYAPPKGMSQLRRPSPLSRHPIILFYISPRMP